MDNKYDMNDEIYELEDQLPTFDADVDVLELLSDATFFGLDDEEKDIPGYIFADALAGMLGMPTEELVDFARDNGYDIFIANSNDNENSDAMFIICAKGCDLDMIKNDYKEIYDAGIEISPVDEVEESSIEEIDDEIIEGNELEDKAKKHKKTDKKGAKGWFVNPNAGNVEHNVAFFNKALGNSTTTADGSVGDVGGMGESVNSTYTKQELIDAVMDAYGLTKAGTLQLIRRMSDNKKELIVKGFKQNAKKSFYEKKENETKEQFVSRFMEDKKTEYKNIKRRFDMAFNSWGKKNDE